MSLAEQLNPEQIAHQLCGNLVPRLQELGISQEEADSSAQMIFAFTQIAVQQVLNEPVLEVPGMEGTVPYTLELAHQCIELFYEGMVHASAKCFEYGVVADTKTQVLQQLAMDVFQNAKQIVASTYGQELTPEIQFSQEQQVEWIRQNAEGTLMYLLNQMEVPAEETHQEANTMGMTMVSPPVDLNDPMLADPYSQGFDVPSDDESLYGPPAQAPQILPPAPPMVHAPIVTPPVVAPAITGQEKYGAVALFLTTLKPHQRDALLTQFNAYERQLIEHYADPEAVVSELHLPEVERQLANLRDRLKAEAESGAFRKKPPGSLVQKLSRQVPPDHLVRLFQTERVSIRNFVMGALHPKRKKQLPPLSPRLEQALSDYARSRFQLE